MEKTRFNVLIASLLAGLLASCAPDASPPPPAPPPPEPPPPCDLALLAASAPPDSLAGEYESIRELLTAGRFVDARPRMVAFLEALATTWGVEDPRIAVFHYDLCVLNGQLMDMEGALTEVERGLARWPRSLQHRVFAATLRLQLARRSGHVRPGTSGDMECLSHPQVAGSVRKTGVEPGELLLAYASVLAGAQEWEGALDAIVAAEAFQATRRKATENRARVLANLRRAEEAIPVLEQLLHEAEDPELRATLAICHREIGQAEPAWDLFRQLLELPVSADLDRGWRYDDRGFRGSVLVHGALCLIDLDRPEEAAPLLFERLLEEPEDDVALHAMSRVLIARGKAEFGAALIRRGQELLSYRLEIDDVHRARNSGREVTADYMNAKAMLELGRTGDALVSLGAGLQRDPSAADLAIFQIDTLFALGLEAAALQAAEAREEATGSPYMQLLRARELIPRGDVSTARELAESTRDLQAPDRDSGIILSARRALVWNDLGEFEEVDRFLAAGEAQLAPSPAPEISILLGAERALAAGDARGARAAVGQNLRNLPRGQARARAIRTLAALALDMAPDEDPSDLVDHELLLRRARGFPGLIASEAAREHLQKVAALIEARRSIIARIDTAPAPQRALHLRDLLELQLRAGAMRKARELAWYLVKMPQAGVREHLDLARALPRPEEIIARLAVVERGLRAFPDDGELKELRRSILEELGGIFSSRLVWLVMVGAALLVGCAENGASAPAVPAPAVPAARFDLVDVAAERGIESLLVNGASPAHYMIETMLGGLAWIDHDGDGDLDLYIAQGHEDPLHGDQPGAVANRLFVNDGEGRFHEAEGAAGAGDHRYSHGVAVGDIDGDDDADLLVTNFGRNTLYENRGGEFTDITVEAGLVEEGYNMSASFFDMDRDGDLDLYVVRYLEYLPATARPCQHGEQIVYCGPRFFDGQHDLLYRNLGENRFEEISVESGITAQSPGKGLGVLTTDLDADGWIDVYVANDTTPNLVWRNLGDGTFEDMGAISGLALSAEGKAQAGMGVDWGDVNADGMKDLIVTNFAKEKNSLYLGQAGGFYSERSGAARLGSTFEPLGFGVALADFDLDGALDLVVANGHVDNMVETHGKGSADQYAQKISLFFGDGDGRFTPVSPAECPMLGQRRVGRGLAIADFDNDGDHDIALQPIGSPLLLFENRAPREGRHWIRLRLIGTASPRDGKNAQVIVTAGGRTRRFEAQSGRSYLSGSDPRVLIGLGEISTIESIRVLWPSGLTQDLGGLEVDREHSIVEAP